MVSLTFLSFLLPPAHTLARLVIPLTSILTILFISSQAAQALPSLPYWTALDVYLCFCCTTTTLALLLTILTSTWERRRGYKGVEDTEGKDAVEKARKCKDRRLTGKSIPAARVLLIQVLLGGKADCGCLLILATLTVLFNIVFWSLCGGAGDDG